LGLILGKESHDDALYGVSRSRIERKGPFAQIFGLGETFLRQAQSAQPAVRIGISRTEFNGLTEVLLRTGGVPSLHASHATQEIGLRSGWCVFDPLGDAFLQKIHISFLTGKF